MAWELQRRQDRLRWIRGCFAPHGSGLAEGLCQSAVKETTQAERRNIVRIVSVCQFDSFACVCLRHAVTASP